MGGGGATRIRVKQVRFGKRATPPSPLGKIRTGGLKNAPACFRDPRASETQDGRTRNFHKKCPKKDWARNSGPQKIPLEYPQNTPKIPANYPRNTKNFHFGHFAGIFGVSSRVSTNFGPGSFMHFFWYFSWKFCGEQSRVSQAGGGILKVREMSKNVDHKLSPPKLPQEGFNNCAGGFEHMICIRAGIAERALLRKKWAYDLHVSPPQTMQIISSISWGESCELMISISVLVVKSRKRFFFFFSFLLLFYYFVCCFCWCVFLLFLFFCCVCFLCCLVLV